MQNHKFNFRRKFQPIITKDNSAKLSELPFSIKTLIKNVSIEQLESLSSYDCFKILYIIGEDSTEGKLKPIRASNKDYYIVLMHK